LSNLLLEAAHERPEVSEYLSTVKGWKEYEENHLKKINVQERTKLGEMANSDDKVEIEDNFLYPLPLLLVGTLRMRRTFNQSFLLTETLLRVLKTLYSKMQRTCR
jgi:hypothetical protein